MTESSEKMMSLRDKMSSSTPAQVTLFLSKQDSQYTKVGKLQFTDVNVDETTDSISLRALFYLCLAAKNRRYWPQ
jgi:tryptophanyl-tRNA synthetase